MTPNLSSSIKALQHYQNNLDPFDVEGVEKCLQTLIDKGIQLARVKPTSNRSPALEIAFPLFPRLLTILKQEDIQCHDRLNALLSKCCRIYIEIIFYQFFDEGRTVSDERKTEWCHAIQTMKKRLPERAVGTEFDLTCCEEALKNIPSDKGVFQKYFPRLVEHGIAESASGLILIAVDVIKEYGKGWYVDVLATRWLVASGPKIITIEEFEQHIKPYVDKYWNRKQYTAIAVADIFFRFISDDDTDTALKEKMLLAKDEASLCELARLHGIGASGLNKVIRRGCTTTDLRKVGHSFWRSRYRAIEHIILCANTDFKKDDCIVFLATQMAFETHPHVSTLFRQTFNATSTEDKQRWKIAWGSLEKEKFQQLLDRLGVVLEDEEKGKEPSGGREEHGIPIGVAPAAAVSPKVAIDPVKKKDLQEEKADLLSLQAAWQSNLTFIEQAMEESS